MNTTPLVEAQEDLIRTEKQTAKLMRAARKGGRGGVALAAAGAALMADVMTQRIALARAAYLVNQADQVVQAVLPLIGKALEAFKARPEAKPGPLNCGQIDPFRKPREFQITLEIRSLVGERASA